MVYKLLLCQSNQLRTRLALPSGGLFVLRKSQAISYENTAVKCCSITFYSFKLFSFDSVYNIFNK
jgi:hypothetical protein